MSFEVNWNVLSELFQQFVWICCLPLIVKHMVIPREERNFLNSNGQTLPQWSLKIMAANLQSKILVIGSLNKLFDVSIPIPTNYNFSGSHWQVVIIEWVNGLALNRQQAITWTNDDPVHWCIYALPGLSELLAKSSTTEMVYSWEVQTLKQQGISFPKIQFYFLSSYSQFK